MKADGVPLCPCGGVVKPDVVLYEEPLDEENVERAISAIERADAINADPIITKPDNLYLYSYLCLASQKSLAGANRNPISIRIISSFGSPNILLHSCGAKA